MQLKSILEEEIKMYTKEPQEQQLSFINDKLIVPFLNPKNHLFKIANTIDWNSLSGKMAKFYCPNNGRPSKPSRLKIGLLILKHLYNNASDSETINLLKENIYAQYLCNIHLEEIFRKTVRDDEKEIIDSSTLSKFREKIGVEGVRIIEQEIFQCLKRAKLLKGRKLILDTTVVPSNITYPTDVSLLEKLRRKTLTYLETAKQFGAKTYRTYKRTAQRVYIQYQKIRQHTVKSRKRTQKKLLQFSRRNVKQLKEALQSIKEPVRKASIVVDKAKERFIQESSKFVDIASTIISQQKNIYRGLPVKERIVSVHQPHIRPMVRGKYPNEVEFGPKVLFSLKNGFLFLDDMMFNNVSDSQLLETGIQMYTQRFGNLPTQLTADRGFWSPENQELAQEYGISKIAIENKGKSSHLRGKPFRERLRRLRCSIEAKISLAKRKFGLDRIRYGRASGEEIWVRLSLISMNLKTAVGYG